jgi:hypothetical protein
MDNVLQKLPNIDLAKNKIFEIILSLPEEEQNIIIKSLRQDLINYRYNNLKTAEKNLKYNQELYHDIFS